VVPALQGRSIVLRHIHDDEAEVHVNGKLLVKLDKPGATDRYLEIRLDQQQSQQFQVGENEIAVHCRQLAAPMSKGSNPQSIDIGIRIE
jgi:hypothetical protein